MFLWLCSFLVVTLIMLLESGVIPSALIVFGFPIFIIVKLVPNPSVESFRPLFLGAFFTFWLVAFEVDLSALIIFWFFVYIVTNMVRMSKKEPIPSPLTSVQKKNLEWEVRWIETRNNQQQKPITPKILPSDNYLFPEDDYSIFPDDNPASPFFNPRGY